MKNIQQQLLTALAVALEDRDTWVRVATWNETYRVKPLAQLLAETYPAPRINREPYQSQYRFRP